MHAGQLTALQEGCKTSVTGSHVQYMLAVRVAVTMLQRATALRLSKHLTKPAWELVNGPN